MFGKRFESAENEGDRKAGELSDAARTELIVKLRHDCFITTSREILYGNGRTRCSFTQMDEQ